MRVLIVTVGSRGDVAPYTGLAARLRAAGHAVTIATHRPFAALVTGTGAGFHPLPGDPRTILDAAALSVRAAPGAVRYLTRLGTALVDAAHGVDVLLTGAAPARLAAHVGAAACVPVLGAYLQPAHPTRAFAPPVSRFGALGGLGNQLSARFVDSVLDRFSAPAIRAVRRRTGLRGGVGMPPVLYGYSPAVLPRPTDWPESSRVVGYWWPETPAGRQPPASLVEFLAAGPPPVYVGLGSVGDGAAARRFAARAVRACRRLGVRIVFSAPPSVDPPTGDDLYRVGDVPHERLFEQVAAVVHHGGAGTTAAALRAGTPSIPVPVLADQYLWARRAVALGVAPGALHLHRASVLQVADVVRAAVCADGYRHRAARLAAVLAAEDGAGAVVDAVERLPH